MPDLYQYDPLFLDLSNNPAVIPILQAVVGLDLQLTEMIAHNHPADTDAHIEWHRDWPPWNHPTQILKAKVFYYLDDITDDMGPFSIVPGSHTRPDDPPGSANSFAENPRTQAPCYTGSELGNMPQMKKITAPAGTAVIWNVALWHTATANTSTRDRRLGRHAAKATANGHPRGAGPGCLGPPRRRLPARAPGYRRRQTLLKPTAQP